MPLQGAAGLVIGCGNPAFIVTVIREVDFLRALSNLYLDSRSANVYADVNAAIVYFFLIRFPSAKRTRTKNLVDRVYKDLTKI